MTEQEIKDIQQIVRQEIFDALYEAKTDPKRSGNEGQLQSLNYLVEIFSRRIREQTGR